MLIKKVRSSKKLDPQPVAQFVKTANQFNSRITLEKGGHRVNGKSMMSVMELSNRQDDSLTLMVEGEDAPQALDTLSHLLEGE